MAGVASRARAVTENLMILILFFNDDDETDTTDFDKHWFLQTKKETKPRMKNKRSIRISWTLRIQAPGRGSATDRWQTAEDAWSGTENKDIEVR